MAHDQIRMPALPRQLLAGDGGRFSADQFGFAVVDPGMGFQGGAALGLPAQQRHPLQLRPQGLLTGARTLAQGPHLPALLSQGRRQVAELAWIVLVNEQDPALRHLLCCGLGLS